MNYSNFNRQNRIIRKRQEKIKKKVVVSIIGKEKIDNRTYKNLKRAFEFIAGKREFTGGQLVKRGMRASVVYELLERLEQKQLIKKVGEKKSPGRGKTDIFSLTVAGEIVAAYINDDFRLLFDALNKIVEKEANPIKRFCLQAFMENYPTDLINVTLEESLRKVGNGKGLNIDELISQLTHSLFLTPFIKRDKKIIDVFRKNAELMEKSEYRNFLFQYFKLQIESLMLFLLEGEKLAKYAESLKEKPELFHYPCDNPKCNNVILIKSFLELPSPPIYLSLIHI